MMKWVKRLSTKTLIWLNLGLGLFFWFLDSTDFSLVGKWTDIIYLVLIVIFALISYNTIKSRNDNKRHLKALLAHLPSLIAGILAVITFFLLLIPPILFGTMSVLVNKNNQTLSQMQESPDGRKIASVYFEFIGITSGDGKIIIKVKDKLIPILEREYIPDRIVEGYRGEFDYIEWIDNSTFIDKESSHIISLGLPNFTVPQLLLIPFAAISTLVCFIFNA